jgi:lycopene beta-cyclase
LIAGGGAAGSLAALAMARFRPEVGLLIVEEGMKFGGDRFQSLFDDELDREARPLLSKLVRHHWPGFYVAFPGASRKLKSGFSGFSSADLHRAVVETLRPDQIRLGTRVVAVREDALVLDGGETIKAEGAIDARGAANLSVLDLLYEVRVERRYRMAAPHGLDRPVLIDATLGESAGLRYVEALPLTPSAMLLSEVLVSERTQPDDQALTRLDAYAALRGWKVSERGAASTLLRPLPHAGDFAAFWRIGGARVAKLGLRGGFFQHATGRATADAAHAAMLLTRQKDFGGPALHDLFEEEARLLWRRREPQRQIVKALADAPADRRIAILSKLFSLEAGLVARLQTDRLGTLDRMRALRTLRDV